MTGVLAFKLTLVPTLVGGITWAGRRWGPQVAGWLSAFPVVSGPILFFVALDQGADFAATAAVGTLTAVLAILAFGICYAWAATRYAWIACAFIGFSAYFASVALLNFWEPSQTIASLVVVGALIAAPKCYPAFAKTDGRPSQRTNDVWLRMLASALLVWIVTHFSSTMGAHLSGLLAMFPAMGSILAIFSHRDTGPGFTIRMLRGMVLGYYAFATFCLVLSLALPPLGIASGFATALTCATLVQLVTRFYL